MLFEVFEITTKKKKDVITISDIIVKFLENSGAKNGILIVSVPHTTASLVINEGEPGLKEDIMHFLDKMVGDGPYKHNIVDKNAEAHLKAIITGNTVSIPVKNGKPLLGKWQDIMMIEHDGPRTRKVVVAFMGS